MNRLFPLLATASLITVGAATAATAGNQDPAQHTAVTICHATPPDTAAQGWHLITPDDDSVVKSGHGRQHDMDIIEAFTYLADDGTTQYYPGKNLTTDFGGVTGQQILDNGCELPGSGGPGEEVPTGQEPGGETPDVGTPGDGGVLSGEVAPPAAAPVTPAAPTTATTGATGVVQGTTTTTGAGTTSTGTTVVPQRVVVAAAPARAVTAVPTFTG
ncbi:MAG: hypothetical protein JWP95_1976 [Actinotalea sp.]|nr:hypothetical protein [Actinotalea sp.]